MNDCGAMNAELAEVALGNAASKEFDTHLRECPACTAELERRRALARRMDAAVNVLVRAEPPSRLLESINLRARSTRRRQQWIGPWQRVALGAVLVAGVIGLMFGLRGLQPPVARGADVAALTAWRSPTRMLLQRRGSVLDVPLDRVTFAVKPRSSRT